MQKLRLYLTIIQIVSYLLVLTNLFRSGLWRKYQYFTWYIAFESLRIPVMLAVPYRSKLYGTVYFATQPISWLFFILVVLELFQLVLRNHAGHRFIRKEGTRCIAGLVHCGLRRDPAHRAARDPARISVPVELYPFGKARNEQPSGAVVMPDGISGLFSGTAGKKHSGPRSCLLGLFRSADHGSVRADIVRDMG